MAADADLAQIVNVAQADTGPEALPQTDVAPVE